MILIIVTSTVLFFLWVLFLLRIRMHYSKNKANLDDLDKQLLILRSFSSLYALKHKSLEDMAGEIVTILLQYKFNTLVLIVNQMKILRFSNKEFTYLLSLHDKKTTVSYMRKIIDRVNFQTMPTPFEEYFVNKLKESNDSLLLQINSTNEIKEILNPKEKESEYAASVKIDYGTQNLGYLLFLSKEKLSKDDLIFFEIVGNIFSFIIKRLEIGTKMDYKMDIEAVNIQW